MSVLKSVFLLLACVTIALAFHIDSRAKRDTTNSTSDSTITTSSDSISSSLNAGNAASALKNAATTIGSGAKGHCIKGTKCLQPDLPEEEKDSVSDSWNNVKELIHQNVETGANLTKTAFDLGTIFPKFGKNLIIGN